MNDFERIQQQLKDMKRWAQEQSGAVPVYRHRDHTMAKLETCLLELKRFVDIEPPAAPWTQIREISGRGEFTGYASVTGVLDAFHEKILAGAFTETLKERGPQFPLLWSHLVTEPIGSVRASEDTIGLKVSGKIDLELEKGREVFQLIKSDVVTGLSIGFISQDWKWEEDVRVITKLKLFECSLCLFPANDSARVTSAKSLPLTAYKYLNSSGEHIATRMMAWA